MASLLDRLENSVRHFSKREKCLTPFLEERITREEALLAVQAAGDGREVVKALVQAKALAQVPLIAVVSEDVDLGDRESLLWGIFTRFAPARDITFSSAELAGAWPVTRGCLGIDATFKPGYPEPVIMDPKITKLVDTRWHHYWTA